MKLVESVTVTSAITSLTFNSIPSVPHLYLVLDLHVHNGNATGFSVKINGEGSGMYDCNGSSSSGGGSSFYSYGYGSFNKTKNNIPVHSAGNSNDRVFAECWFPFANSTEPLITNDNRSSNSTGGGKQCLFRAQSLGYGWYGKSYGWGKCYTASRISSLTIDHSTDRIDTGSKISLWQLEY